MLNPVSSTWYRFHWRTPLANHGPRAGTHPRSTPTFAHWTALMWTGYPASLGSADGVLQN